MAKKDTPRNEKGNGGYLWSSHSKMALSFFWALVLLLIQVSPALAAGVGFIGGK